MLFFQLSYHRSGVLIEIVVGLLIKSIGLHRVELKELLFIHLVQGAVFPTERAFL